MLRNNESNSKFTGGYKSILYLSLSTPLYSGVGHGLIFMTQSNPTINLWIQSNPMQSDVHNLQPIQSNPKDTLYIKSKSLIKKGSRSLSSPYPIQSNPIHKVPCKS